MRHRAGGKEVYPTRRGDHLVQSQASTCFTRTPTSRDSSTERPGAESEGYGCSSRKLRGRGASALPLLLREREHLLDSLVADARVGMGGRSRHACEAASIRCRCGEVGIGRGAIASIAAERGGRCGTCRGEGHNLKGRERTRSTRLAGSELAGEPRVGRLPCGRAQAQRHRCCVRASRARERLLYQRRTFANPGAP